jgi:hypothetical protein
MPVGRPYCYIHQTVVYETFLFDHLVEIDCKSDREYLNRVLIKYEKCKSSF